VLSDWWDGLDAFFTPGEEILIAHDTDDALAALDRPPDELRRIGARARDRVLSEHTAAHRARRMLELLCGEPARPVQAA
jgi:spore maturation protein CgeB